MARTHEGSFGPNKVRIGRDESDTQAVFLATPHVFVGRVGRNVGPTMLRNVVALANHLEIPIIRATSSMNMGRALTTAGFLPGVSSWPNLRRKLIEVAEREFRPMQLADGIVQAIWSDGPLSVRQFVAGPGLSAGAIPPLTISSSVACKTIFMKLSWEAEFDLRDLETRRRYDWWSTFERLPDERPVG